MVTKLFSNTLLRSVFPVDSNHTVMPTSPANQVRQIDKASMIFLVFKNFPVQHSDKQKWKM